MSALIILLLPGVLAGIWSNRFHQRQAGEGLAVRWACYTLLIDWMLCLLKILRGWGSWSLEQGFNSSKSFAAYGLIALLLAFILPLLETGTLRWLDRCGQKICWWAGELSQLLRGNSFAEGKNQTTSKTAWGWREAFSLRLPLKRMAVIFAASVAVASGLIILVSAIPDQRIDQNIKLSAEKMTKEGKYPEWIPGMIYQRVDNWTEASLLNQLYNGDSRHPVESAFGQKEYRPQGGGTSGVDRLAAAVDEGEKDGQYTLRSTYWLGQRVLLLPLLYFTDYYSIRSILWCVSALVVFGTAVMLVRRVDLHVGVMYFLTILLANFHTAGLQWTNGILCLWIVGGILWYATGREGREIDHCSLFLLAGILTSYFDWFSSPLLTFGLPVLVLLYLEAKREQPGEFYRCFQLVFRSGLGWCLGYGLMLGARVLLTTLVGGEGSLNNFLERMFYNITSRGTAEASGFSQQLGTILDGAGGIFPLALGDRRTTAAVLLCGFVLFTLLTVLLRKKVPVMGILLLVSLAPFAWFIVFHGYCRVHFWIAYRVFGITAMSWMLMASLTLRALGTAREGRKGP